VNIVIFCKHRPSGGSLFFSNISQKSRKNLAFPYKNCPLMSFFAVNEIYSEKISKLDEMCIFTGFFNPKTFCLNQNWPEFTEFSGFQNLFPNKGVLYEQD
jgi:hypothetical protein